MTATERLQAEQLFHDQQAHRRACTFVAAPEAYLFADPDYLDHESWIRPAFGKLGDVRGLDVLDLGCGHGMAGIVLSRWGAHVTALELSSGYLREARARAAANRTSLHVVCGDAERLPFADACFDRVWGNAVLHHLDVGRAAEELHRILRPGGRAVFCEPWGENRLLDWARRNVRYPGKARTPEETPLRLRQLRILRAVFAGVEVQGYQLLAMAGRALGKRTLIPSLSRLDQKMFQLFPGLQRFCRYVVVTLEKRLHS